jgi:hypothetical protein
LGSCSNCGIALPPSLPNSIEFMTRWLRCPVSPPSSPRPRGFLGNSRRAHMAGRSMARLLAWGLPIRRRGRPDVFVWFDRSRPRRWTRQAQFRASDKDTQTGFKPPTASRAPGRAAKAFEPLPSPRQRPPLCQRQGMWDRDLLCLGLPAHAHGLQAQAATTLVASAAAPPGGMRAAPSTTPGAPGEGRCLRRRARRQRAYFPWQSFHALEPA